MIKFGTSGFRGILADNYTKENLQKIAYALCEIAKEDGLKNPSVVIGYDNRFMSKDFAKWTSEVLATTMLVKFYDFPVPTPLVSFETKSTDYGIMLTASHNPYCYNGLKLLLKGGRDCDDDFAKRIEKIANKVKASTISSISFEQGIQSKRIVIVKDIKKYCDDILSLVNIKKIQKKNMKILVNCMHGNSADCLKYIFGKLKLDCTFINENIDPYFENRLPAPYKQNLQEQIKMVVSGKYDLGIALDGDGDRFSMISASGTYYDCNFVSAVLFYYLVNIKGIKGGVTKGLPLTSLITKLANYLEVNCYETVVGFKNIGKSFMKTDSIFGIESNGIALKSHSLLKDGPLVAGLIVDALSEYGMGFDTVLNELQKAMNFKSELAEVAYPISQKQQDKLKKILFVDKKLPKLKNRKIKNTNYVDGVKVTYEGDYWIMLRFSGTEPILRVYVEMKDMKECNTTLATFEKFLGIKERQ